MWETIKEDINFSVDIYSTNYKSNLSNLLSESSLLYQLPFINSRNTKNYSPKILKKKVKRKVLLGTFPSN